MREHCKVCCTGALGDDNVCDRCGYGVKYQTFEEARAAAFQITKSNVKPEERMLTTETRKCRWCLEGDVLVVGANRYCSTPCRANARIANKQQQYARERAKRRRARQGRTRREVARRARYSFAFAEDTPPQQVALA